MYLPEENVETYIVSSLLKVGFILKKQPLNYCKAYALGEAV